MKAAGKEVFQPLDEEAISHYSLCDCLDLLRKIQFMGLKKTWAQKKILVSLKARIISLVLPQGGYYPGAKPKAG